MKKSIFAVSLMCLVYGSAYAAENSMDCILLLDDNVEGVSHSVPQHSIFKYDDQKINSVTLIESKNFAVRIDVSYGYHNYYSEHINLVLCDKREDDVSGEKCKALTITSGYLSETKYLSLTFLDSTKANLYASCRLNLNDKFIPTDETMKTVPSSVEIKQSNSDSLNTVNLPK